MVFKFCRKYPINKQAFKNKLFFKNFRKLSEMFVLESLCYKILDNSKLLHLYLCGKI